MLGTINERVVCPNILILGSTNILTTIDSKITNSITNLFSNKIYFSPSLYGNNSYIDPTQNVNNSLNIVGYGGVRLGYYNSNTQPNVSNLNQLVLSPSGVSVNSNLTVTGESNFKSVKATLIAIGDSILSSTQQASDKVRIKRQN